MPRALPKELRVRVVEAWEAGEGSFSQLAARFMVGEATVNRWVALKRKTGALAPRPMGTAGGRPRSVDAAGAEFLRGLLEEIPDVTLEELSASYLEARGIAVSPQTMSATVRRLGLTRKRGPSVRELPSVKMW